MKGRRENKKLPYITPILGMILWPKNGGTD